MTMLWMKNESASKPESAGNVGRYKGVYDGLLASDMSALMPHWKPL